MEKNSKKTPKYSCLNCHFYTCNLQDFNRHLCTRKHISQSQGDIKEIKNSNGYVCECGKKYSVYSSLWRHKKTCSPKEENIIAIKNELLSSDANELVTTLINQNKELQNLLIEERKIFMEEIKNTRMIQNNTITNSNNNSNNSFNLNFFLNEQCKNAINLVDFIDSLQIGVKDLERTGKLGYVEGISQIFLNGLKELDVYNRPIHCTDLKRETVYVRDQDKWEKENEEKTKLHQAVKKITVKNIKQLPKWEEENPEYSDFDSKKNDEYMAISKSSLGGYDSEEDKKYKETIIKNVLKNTKVPAKEERTIEQ